jgi:predicted HTH domain antitoxin
MGNISRRKENGKAILQDRRGCCHPLCLHQNDLPDDQRRATQGRKDQKHSEDLQQGTGQSHETGETQDLHWISKQPNPFQNVHQVMANHRATKTTIGVGRPLFCVIVNLHNVSPSEEKTMDLTAQSLVEAQLYPDQEAVIQDALRSLLHEKPQLRTELAIHRYQNEEISLARAAHMARVSFDRMKEILVKRGIAVRLGPKDEDEARQEIENMGRILAERKS